MLLTGASAGIGRALAEELAPRAGKLVVVARRMERLEALAEALRKKHPRLEVHVRGCDLGDVGAARALVGEVERSVGPVDVVGRSVEVDCSTVVDVSSMDSSSLPHPPATRARTTAAPSAARRERESCCGGPVKDTAGLLG